MGKFLITSGELEGRKFRLEAGAKIVLGREKADLSFLDRGMSRKHCIIDGRDDGDHVVDAGATNGTWVNGKRITEQLLEVGDVIRVGFTDIEYLGDVAPSPAADTQIVRRGNQTMAFRASDLKPALDAVPDVMPDSEEGSQVTRRDRKKSSAKSRIMAAKRAAMGVKSFGDKRELISAKGKFCEACGEAIFAKAGAEDEGILKDGLYLCRMCHQIQEKQAQLGGDYLPSYAKIVSGRVGPSDANADPNAPAPVFEEEEVDLDQLVGAPKTDEEKSEPSAPADVELSEDDVMSLVEDAIGDAVDAAIAATDKKDEDPEDPFDAIDRQTNR